MSLDQVTRRNFLKTAGVATAGLSIAASTGKLAGQSKKTAANDMLQIGVIGTGSRGNHLLQNLMTIEGVKITACCDIDQKNLKKGVKLAGGDAFAAKDYREILAKPDIDAVVVATPLYLHAPMAIDAMRAGKHVLCEKTMAYDIPQVLAMMQCVKETGMLLQVGHQRRYSPLYQKVVQMVRNGVIGKVTTIRAQWHRNGDWRRSVKDPKEERDVNWRLYREYSGGLMTELATHQIQVVNWLLGETPVAVVGIGGIDYWTDNREIFDNIQVIYSYPSGVKFVYSSITTNEFYGCNEQIMGTEGTIEMSTSGARLYREKGVKRTEFENFVMDFERQMLQSVAVGTASFLPEDPTKDMGTEIAVPGMTHDETYYSLEHFAKCLRTGEPILCDVIDGGNAAISGHIGNLAMDQQELVTWPEKAKLV
ncbi:Gfo/Idh/MocA family oxidoreductase [candidate division KSB1 bacterium]|nr:Gfo/Idh/MocA family oxidoreductase [candidate division KSB1 bacterium]